MYVLGHFVIISCAGVGFTFLAHSTRYVAGSLNIMIVLNFAIFCCAAGVVISIAFVCVLVVSVKIR